MVVALGPGKFYGSSLPRPRIYTDVKLNDVRVDPPTPILDPFLSWANDAHWSMGGLSFKRVRLQGRIEGNVEKLRKEKERSLKKKKKESGTPKDELKMGLVSKFADDLMDLPPPAPMARKRGNRMANDNNNCEEERDSTGVKRRRRLVRKLGKDFDEVASEKEIGGNLHFVGSRTRSQRSVAAVVVEEEDSEKVAEVAMEGKRVKKGRRETGSVSPSGIRTSPRLSKQRSR